MRAGVLAAVTAVAVAIGTAGCGSAPSDNGEQTKTGPQVLADAAGALRAAGSTHFVGSGGTGGKRSRLDLWVQSGATSGFVTLDDIRVDVVNIAGKAYLRGPAAFWQRRGITRAAGARLADRWVVAPSQESEFGDLSLEGLAHNLQAMDSKVKKEIGTDHLQGRKVVVVTKDDGSQLLVAASGKPLPLGTRDTGKDPGSASFSEFGKTVTITAPADAVPLPDSRSRSGSTGA